LRKGGKKNVRKRGNNNVRNRGNKNYSDKMIEVLRKVKDAGLCNTWLLLHPVGAQVNWVVTEYSSTGGSILASYPEGSVFEISTENRLSQINTSR
jgi:hypothetical protein